MRSRSLVLLLALSGISLSGCASGFDEAYLSNATSSSGGTGSDGISGDSTTTGTGNENTFNGGSTTIAFVDGARDITGAGNTNLSISATGVATVAVSPGTALGFQGTKVLPTYVTQTAAQTAPTSDPYYAAYGFDNTNYTEFRQITQTSDNELQYWEFNNSAGNSYAAHFRDATNNQDAWFFGGTGATDETTAPAITGGATVNYNGNYAGVATTTGWVDAAAYATANGQWRMNGTAAMTANFGTGQFIGRLTPEYWEKFENQDFIQIDVPNNTVEVNQTGIRVNASAIDIQAFHTATVELNGTINGNTFSGTSDVNTQTTNAPGDTTNNRFVNGDRALQGGFFGNNAEAATGVFSTYAIAPSPGGGDTGINDDRRGTIDIQGVFHGQ